MCRMLSLYVVLFVKGEVAFPSSLKLAGGSPVSFDMYPAVFFMVDGAIETPSCLDMHGQTGQKTGVTIMSSVNHL